MERVQQYHINIINGEKLQSFNGEKVSIIGLIIDVANDGLNFTIRSTDNATISVKLKRPFNGRLEGYVEVRGTCFNKTIQADECIIFQNSEFDATGYNALVDFVNKIPSLCATD